MIPFSESMRTTLLLCVFGLALVSARPAGCQHFPADEDLETILRLLVEDREAPGIVLGIREADGTTRILHHGSGGPEARSLGRSSVFDIGSITKTFTATLLAEMALRNEVALDDPVARFLPKEVRVPSRGGREITLLDLATHMSGLPSLPANLRTTSRLDPYVAYTVGMLYEFLVGHELHRNPGEQYEYSNVGYGLLGHTLARAAGMTYRELVRERVLEPLGMESTGYALEGDPAANMVQGHRFGAAVPHWSVTEAMEGAGGLRSSAGDMLKYLEANVGAPTTELERAMRLSHALRVPQGDAGAGQGLAWRTVLSPAGGAIVHHGGSTGGFRGGIAFMPQQGIGTVVLTNENTFRDALGMDLLRHPPPAGWERVHVPARVLSRYAGEYEERSGDGTFYLRLEEEGYLTFQPALQVRTTLHATSDTTFYLPRSPWTLTFREGEERGSMEMLMEVDERDPNEEGRQRTARKIGRAPPRRRIVPTRESRSRRSRPHLLRR